MALTKTARTLVASVSNGAGSKTRGRLDMNAVQGGGFLTIKMINGSTGPTVQCTCNILIAHNGTLPAAASAGTDWKTIASYGGGTVANYPTEIGIPIDPSIMCLEVEFTGNTGQAVTVEAYLSELTAAV
ncbi:MAG: hypothetical protein H0U72_04455 [Nitrosospira sp.]|nr:hypothetical protein [Nitrosospira sp.]